MNKLLAWIHQKLVNRCPHPAHHVSADLLEGDFRFGWTRLQWCRLCGAHRFVYLCRETENVLTGDEWRKPEPLPRARTRQ